MTEFDRFAGDYERILADTVRAGGSPAFFQRTKARLIRRLLGPGFAGTLLDFGCGVGGLLRELRDAVPGATLHGYDPSAESVAGAAGIDGIGRVMHRATDLEVDAYDTVVLANVLHHIEPGDRDATLRRVATLLRTTGTVIVFEHNPYNPLTRRVVARCPFDEDVELLRPAEVRARLRDAGFVDVRTRFTTFFPQWLAALLPLERLLAKVPLGAQTCTTGRAGAP